MRKRFWKVDGCRVVSPDGLSWRSDHALFQAAAAEAEFISRACNAAMRPARADKEAKRLRKIINEALNLANRLPYSSESADIESKLKEAVEPK